jgi:hypothetical protein
VCVFKYRWLKSYASAAIWCGEFLLISKIALEEETVLSHSAALYLVLII